MDRPMKSLIRFAACFACLIAVAALPPAAHAQHEDPGHATPANPTGTAQPDTAHAPDAAHPGDDHAAGGHEASPFPNKNEGLVVGIANLVIFSLVFAVLAAKVWPTINKGLADREAKIKHEIEAAEAARRQAKEALESYERSLAEARN